MGFRVAEKFRLEVHWNKIVYEQNEVAKILGCYLSGPAVKEAAKMNEVDSISLDFANQYIVLLPYYYVAKLSWNGINQMPEKIVLFNTVLENKHITSIPKLQDTDYIVIDTQDHEDAKHFFHPTYSSYLIRHDGELYNFGSK